MTERGFARGKCSSRPRVRRSWRAGAYGRYYGLLTCTSTATFPPPTVQRHKLRGEGEITVITSLSGPKCRRGDGLCACVSERDFSGTLVCVAFSWFLISINILCAAFGGVCQVCLANMELPAIHAGCATSAVFPIPAVQVGEEGFFFWKQSSDEKRRY